LAGATLENEYLLTTQALEENQRVSRGDTLIMGNPGEQAARVAGEDNEQLFGSKAGSDSKDVSGEEINAPLVLQCSKCHFIVGDSLSFVCSDEASQTITLTGN
jgi:hypothetical protein